MKNKKNIQCPWCSQPMVITPGESDAGIYFVKCNDQGCRIKPFSRPFYNEEQARGAAEYERPRLGYDRIKEILTEMECGPELWDAFFPRYS